MFTLSVHVQKHMVHRILRSTKENQTSCAHYSRRNDARSIALITADFSLNFECVKVSWFLTVHNPIEVMHGCKINRSWTLCLIHGGSASWIVIKRLGNEIGLWWEWAELPFKLSNRREKIRGLWEAVYLLLIRALHSLSETNFKLMFYHEMQLIVFVFSHCILCALQTTHRRILPR